MKPGSAGALHERLCPVSSWYRWMARPLMSTNHTACSDADQNGPSPSNAPTGHTHSTDALANCLSPLPCLASMGDDDSTIPRVHPVAVPGAQVRIVGGKEH